MVDILYRFYELLEMFGVDFKVATRDIGPRLAILLCELPDPNIELALWTPDPIVRYVDFLREVIDAMWPCQDNIIPG
jgi:hypothetical protein